MPLRLVGLLLVGLLTAGCSPSADPASGRAPREDVAASDEPSPTTDEPPATEKPSVGDAQTGTHAPTTPAPGEGTEASSAFPLGDAVIAIDPGHNGGNAEHPEEISRLVDAGGFEKVCNTTGTATDSGYSEATFNFEVAHRLRRALEDRGATVHLTRDSNDGVGPCIDDRGRFGSAVGADLLVSIHADGAEPAGHGFHVLHPGELPGYTDDISAASAALAEALRDALVDAGMRPSTYLGDEGMMARTDLGTLNLADVPAVLVESGNMRNPDDARRLASAQGQELIAAALADGIASFLARGPGEP